jgi:hypothetical protein
MKYLTILLILTSCSPTPSRVSADLKTGDQGEYRGTDVAFSWDLQ